MRLYELTLVVNRLQEKAIRDVFDQHSWKFIIAGIKKCEIPRLPLSPHGSKTESSHRGGDFKDDVKSSNLLVGHTESNSKGSCEEMSDAEDCGADDDSSDKFQTAPGLCKIGDRLLNGQGPKIEEQSILKKELDEEATETMCHQQGEEVQPQLRNGEQLPQPVPLSMNSALALEKPAMFSNNHGITSNQISVHCMSKDVTIKTPDVGLQKEFDCGNCWESFATFSELRTHLQQHKRAIEGAPKRALAIASLRRNQKRGKKCRMQNVSNNSERRNDSQGVHENGVNSVKEKASLRKRGRPRKPRPEPPNKTSESGVDTFLSYDCGNCSESFSSFTELRLHLQLHKEAIEGARPLPSSQTDTGRNICAGSRRCETCYKTFPNASARRLHDRVHTGERPYLCNECGKAFKQRTAFQNHLRTHTGEMPFKCGMCATTFRQLVGLHRHQRRHTGEKPQLCTVCGKRFAERGYLKSHMRLHTGEKPFSCALCEKSFSQRTSLKCHMKSHHKNNPENSALQPPLTPNRERTRDSHQTHTSSNEKDECEIQPNTSPCTGGDTRTNGHRKSTKDLTEGSYHTDLVLPHHDHTTPIVSPAYTQSTHTENYGSDNSALQLPHTQFIQMDPGSNNQPLPSLHGDRYMSGFFQNT